MKHLRHAALLSTVKTAGVCLLLLLGHALGGNAQELRINQVSFVSPNQVTITYDSQAGATYVMLQGYSVTNISTAVATNPGIAFGVLCSPRFRHEPGELYCRIPWTTPNAL